MAHSHGSRGDIGTRTGLRHDLVAGPVIRRPDLLVKHTVALGLPPSKRADQRAIRELVGNNVHPRQLSVEPIHCEFGLHGEKSVADVLAVGDVFAADDPTPLHDGKVREIRLRSDGEAVLRVVHLHCFGGNHSGKSYL
ncbi:MAG: hypothetical protein ACK559_35140, partial [bacterium]